MVTEFMHKIIRPIVIPICVAAVVAAAIIGFGTVVLEAHVPGDKDRFGRPELWIALGAALVVLFLFTYLAFQPQKGVLSRDVVIGKRPFFATSGLPQMPVSVRSGAPGTVADIAEGYTLYAQEGALATALGQLPGSEDHGKKFAGFIYAKGLNGASAELWIPIEAVLGVYPETKSAFLSIKGDETEAFGWNVPPENIRRGPARKQSAI